MCDVGVSEKITVDSCEFAAGIFLYLEVVSIPFAGQFPGLLSQGPYLEFGLLAVFVCELVYGHHLLEVDKC